VAKNPDAVRRVIGVIPQALTSDPDLPSRRTQHLRQALQRPQVERENNINEVLEAVDLVKWRGAQVKTLSGGMRRRVEIARGLVHNPQIFFSMNPPPASIPSPASPSMRCSTT